jgi:hypothetical protein
MIWQFTCQPQRNIRKRKTWIIIGLFRVSLEFETMMKNLIFGHSTAFLTYTSFWLDYINSRSLSSCNNIKTFDFFALYTTILFSKLKRQINSSNVCHKKDGQRRYKYACHQPICHMTLASFSLWVICNMCVRNFYSRLAWNLFTVILCN